VSVFGPDRRERRGTPFDALVVGLGNPGREYERSRHNVGAECVALLARRVGASMRAGRDRAVVAETRFGERRVVLALPTTYMNDSGDSVGRLARRYGLERPEQLVVVHDELDLPPGVVRVKAGGGLAGHNGLRSIVQHLKTEAFLRVRIGVGKPPSKEHGAGHVLGRVPARERELLDTAVAVAADAVESIVADGVEAAMRAFNGRPA
jgi:PTH1 family peptidyl-tRNA hydrolase